MMKPKLLDLFCKAGGASMGYARAGFDVEGVDIKPQPNYPFTFHQADALTFPLDGYAAYHASPPCQTWSQFRYLTIHQGRARQYQELIAPIRDRLIESGRPYVIENVPGAPLIDPIMICGSSFGLPIRRHRLFEISFAMLQLPCCHFNEVRDKPPLHRLRGHSRVVGCYGRGRGKGDNIALWKSAMGITWMTRAEMAEAIPPAYTEFIGKYMLIEVSRADGVIV